MTVRAFFEPLGGDRYRASEYTVGPWDPGLQHGGPPSALLARAIELESPSWPAVLARISMDILGPIPVGELTVRSRVLRPGRSVEPMQSWFFINSELTVHFSGVPAGEWICLEAATRIDAHGFGLATSRLFDRTSPIGNGAQTLYVGAR